jgi:ribosomal protein L31
MYFMVLVGQNNYPLREWHMEHMQKTIIKYVIGIPENTATNFQKRLHKRYNGNLTYVCKNIGFDIKHGVTNDQVLAFIDKVKSDPVYANMQQNTDSIERLESLEKHFTAASLPPSYLQYLVH